MAITFHDAAETRKERFCFGFNLVEHSFQDIKEQGGKIISQYQENMSSYHKMVNPLWIDNNQKQF